MRSKLRLSDLRGRSRTESRLMNVKIPVDLSDAIHRVARELDCSITDVYVALTNEGLDAAAEVLKDWKPSKIEVPPPKRVCSVAGCGKAYVAKGLCANHYQSMRRGEPVRPKARKR